MPITNINGVGLSVAVLLAHDNYDYDNRKNAISATTLLKSVKQVALQVQVKEAGGESLDIDVTDLVASRTGSATHDALEHVWLKGHYKSAMRSLGYQKDIIEAIKVNPASDELVKGDIPVYVEIRGEIEVDGTIITGKFDFVGDGKLEDLKNTIEWVVVKTLKELKGYRSIMDSKEPMMRKIELIYSSCPKVFAYIMQGSIYRLIHGDIITKKYMSIQFIIKDFKKYNSNKDDYPNMNPYELKLDLFPTKDVLEWIRIRVAKIKASALMEQKDMKPCTKSELWSDPSKWKYFTKPDSKRAYRAFDNPEDAYEMCESRGSGIVKEVIGKPKACLYCANRFVCEQAAGYIRQGLIEV